jgi:hypothetical protein
LIVFSYFYIPQAIQGLLSAPRSVLQTFGATAAGFLIFYGLFLRRRSDFWQTLFHEVTHAFFAVLTFNKITGILATDGNGGEILYRGKSNWVISLSPYFFPIHTLPLVILLYLVSSQYTFHVKIAIVVSFTFFLITAFKQFSIRQTDITKSGVIFSLIVVLLLNIYIINYIFNILIYPDGTFRYVELLIGIMHNNLIPLLESLLQKNILLYLSALIPRSSATNDS